MLNAYSEVVTHAGVQVSPMPTITDLDAAMTQPAHFVPAVRQLGNGVIRLDQAGHPIREHGRDAVVYELRGPTGRIVALRCFLIDDTHRNVALAQRYAAMRGDPSLERLRQQGGVLPREISWFADGLIDPSGGRSARPIPLLAMERIPGRTMAQVVHRVCLAGESDPLALLADQWLTTMRIVDGAGFVHGDLAPDNLMVRPDGSIALIDLDNACWPTAPSRQLVADPEAAYGHPAGQAHDWKRRDNFPALLIWASLRILSRHPHLQQQFGKRPDRPGSGLLWGIDDLLRPDNSPLFATLDALDDGTLRPLLEIVRRAIRFPPDDTPPLSEISERLESLGFPALASTPGKLVRRIASRATPLEVPAPPAAPPVAPPSEAPVKTTLEPGSIAENLAGTAPAPTRPVPPPIDRTRTERLVRELEKAIATRDARTVLQAWDAVRQLDEAASYSPAVHEVVQREVSAALDRAHRRRDDAALLSAVAEAERFGIAPTATIRAACREARERVDTKERLARAIDNNDYEALARLKRLGSLDALGPLAPVVTRAVERSLTWPALVRAIELDDDAAIIAAADPALWREETSMSRTVWERLELARRRQRWTTDVRAALRQRDVPVLRGLLSSAPPGAEEQLTEVESRRLLRLTMREAAVIRLEQALRTGPDREIVAALSEFESAGAPFSAVLDWTAVRGVVDRISLADAIRAATAIDPPDMETLARLLPAARAALGAGSGGNEPDWPALESSVLQAAHLARLREALASDNDLQIASAAVPDPYDAIAQLSPMERERIQAALQNRFLSRR
jgi:hypothetical protein